MLQKKETIKKLATIKLKNFKIVSNVE